MPGAVAWRLWCVDAVFAGFGIFDVIIAVHGVREERITQDVSAAIDDVGAHFDDAGGFPAQVVFGDVVGTGQGKPCDVGSSHSGTNHEVPFGQIIVRFARELHIRWAEIVDHRIVPDDDIGNGAIAARGRPDFDGAAIGTADENAPFDNAAAFAGIDVNQMILIDGMPRDVDICGIVNVEPSQSPGGRYTGNQNASKGFCAPNFGVGIFPILAVGKFDHVFVMGIGAIPRHVDAVELPIVG